MLFPPPCRYCVWPKHELQDIQAVFFCSLTCFRRLVMAMMGHRVEGLLIEGLNLWIHKPRTYCIGHLGLNC